MEDSPHKVSEFVLRELSFCLRRCRFFQGGGAGLFAALTEFTANMKPPVMEPPLSMGPPGSESLKPHLKNVPQLPPVVNNRLLPEPKPQSGGMASDHKMHESAEVLQPGDWIIPYSYVTSY